VTAGQS